MSCDWLHFAQRTGEAGTLWAIAYLRHLSKVELSDKALALMRKGDLEQGKRELEHFATQLANDPAEEVSVRSVLWRWYYGVEGYYLYCTGDFEQARLAMQRAHEAVRSAISSAEWLAMLAIHCQEFCLHQARIARNQRNWPEMHAQIARANSMMRDELPLCDAGAGREIYFRSFERFFSSMSPFSAEEADIVSRIVGREQRVRSFDQFVRRMLRLPEFAIDYV
jgi:tetratricopeptide (TPR) repeat protein